MDGRRRKSPATDDLRSEQRRCGGLLCAVLDKRLFELANSALVAGLVLGQLLRVEPRHVEYQAVRPSNVIQILFEESLRVCGLHDAVVLYFHQTL